MNQLEQIREISSVNNGILRTFEVINKGISKTTLAKFIDKNNYERVSHGSKDCIFSRHSFIFT